MLKKSAKGSYTRSSCKMLQHVIFSKTWILPGKMYYSDYLWISATWLQYAKSELVRGMLISFLKQVKAKIHLTNYDICSCNLKKMQWSLC